ncbi:hypothetical protein G9A89_006373 [Geosiphon pyriformis]|nr:hypothetical protein G9A89_006373 [Geosiphon pyriformis]
MATIQYSRSQKTTASSTTSKPISQPLTYIYCSQVTEEMIEYARRDYAARLSSYTQKQLRRVKASNRINENLKKNRQNLKDGSNGKENRLINQMHQKTLSKNDLKTIN